MDEKIAEITKPDPPNVTGRYLDAEILAVFIDPPQSPDTILTLGPDIIAYVMGRLTQVLDGDDAKKRLATGSAPPATT